MAFEKKWPAVPPQAFTVNGNSFGLIAISDTANFKVKQSAYLKNTAGSELAVQIKRVISSTQLIVGAIDNRLSSWLPLDITFWTVASGAQIGAEEQDKNNIPEIDHYKAIYEADPIIADRIIPVDKYGNYYDDTNRFPVNASLTVENINIGQVDQGNPNTLANGWPVKPTDGTNSQSYTGSGEAKVSVTQPLPSGTNSIGQVTANAGSGIFNIAGAVSSSQSGIWNVGRTWTLSNGTDSVTTFQGTSPWTISGTVAASQSGSWDINNITGTISLPTGAATESTLSAINTKINQNFGSPTVAIRTASLIGNSSGSADFNSGITTSQTLRVVLPTDQSAIPVSQNGTWTVQQGTPPWSVVQSGNWFVRLQDASGTGLTSTLISGKQALDVNIAGDSFTIETGIVDKSAFVYGTSSEQPIGGVYQDTAPTLSSGTTGAARLTQFRAFHSNLRDSSGNELLGSKTSANSIPIVIASDQSTIPVSAIQSGSWTVTSNQGTSPWITSGTVTNLPSTVDTNYGTASSSTIRTAAQIGNATGSAAFGAGVTTAQVLRVVLPTDQSAIPVTQSTSPWVTSRNWTLSSGTDSVNIGNFPATQAVTQSTSPWVISGTVTANIGTTNGLTLDTTLAKLTLAQGSTTSGETGPLIQGAVTSSSPSYITAQTSPLSLTTAGALRVDGSAITQPISGTITSITNPVAVTQSGIWSVTSTQGTSPWITSGAVTNFPTTVDTNYGTVGASTIRTASQIGNATGSAAFGAGTTSAQTLRVVLPTDQSAIPVTQSGSWTTGRTWTLASGTDSIASVQSGTWSVTANAGTNLNTSALALDTTLTNRTQKTQITDGTHDGTIKAASTAAIATDTSLVVALSPNSPLPAGTNVIGALSANQSINEAQVGGNTIATGAGTTTSGVQRVVLPTDQSAIPVTGTINTTPSDGTKTSYSAAVIGLASAILATDIFTITGSATKIIRITRIEISGTTTAGSGISINLQLIKRSADDSGGTSTILTNVPHDSTNPSATVTVKSYTANPTTLGTSVGVVRSQRAAFVNAGAGDFNNVWTFGDRPSQAIVLRGISQILAVNLGSITVTGPAIDINIEWTEE